MQYQAQVGLYDGQGSQFVRNEFPISKQTLPAWRKPWHTKDDSNLRREIFSQIIQLVQKRGLEKNLLEIAKDVEMALYLDAASKEEYGDLRTLEARICSLTLRLRSGYKSAQQGAQPGPLFSNASIPSASNGGAFPVGSTITSTPGLRGVMGIESAGNSFSRNGGHAGTAPGYSKNSFSSVSKQPPLSSQYFSQGQGSLGGQCGYGVAGQMRYGNSSMPITGSCMIPTPGLNMASSAKPTEQDARVRLTENPREPQLSTDPFNQNGSFSSGFQSGGVLAPNFHSVPILGKGEGMVNGYSFYDSSLNLEEAFLHAHSQFPNGVIPQPLNGVTEASTNPANILEGGGQLSSLLPLGMGGGNSAASEATNLVSKTVGEQQDSKLSQKSSRGTAIQSSPFSMLSQQQLQGNISFSNPDHLVEGNRDTVTSRPQLQDHLKMDVLPLPQAMQVFENQNGHHCDGNQRQHDQQMPRQPFQKSISHISHIDSQVHNSEQQACQASSADTGQSEVVSNDDGLVVPSRVERARNLPNSQQVKRQQWLLIFLRHVSRCIDSGQCTVAHCAVGRESWKHLTSCRVYPCSYPRCSPLKWLLGHHQKCRNAKCVVCGPVRNYFSQQAAALRAKLRKDLGKQLEGTIKVLASFEVDSPPMKRPKLEVSGTPWLSQQPAEVVSTPEKSGSSRQDILLTSTHELRDSLSGVVDIEHRSLCQKTERSHLKIESPSTSSLSAGSHFQGDSKLGALDVLKVELNSASNNAVIEEGGSLTAYKSLAPAAITNNAITPEASSDGNKPSKAKVSGISYIETFSPEQIRQHISSLRKWIGQSKGKAEKNQALERQMLASACSACGVENLHFDPIPIFCTQCGCRIKRNSTYHSTGTGDNSFNFCGPCYGASREDVLETDGFKVQRSTLVKKKNDEQRVEGWVQCDKCKKWQHQICVLFNARINKERSEYVCPDCCIAEMERSERMPLCANSILGAKDLPTTILSDYLEKRLAVKLEEERTERARASGKSCEEVVTAEGLVVRVISSVDKKLDVKPKFLEVFQQEDYPKDYMYKSKMVMLFQKIEGVEVCLFGMYVQEFGSDSPSPNHRWVYLSYLDSVKYFRPEVKTAWGEALRTYVYHEILIGYLDYCKKRGFSSCYIWACPPLKGDDYILYCHPEIQKTPKTDKLREWYLNMIAKAKREKIVIANKNLYDFFFTTGGDCKAKVTAARLPYFDGDYWPGAAEDILQQLQQEKDGSFQKRGKINKIPPKRTTKTSSQTDSGSLSKDVQLMNKLGQSIAAMKEDFIIVHLHQACSRCRNFIISGRRWVCHQCVGSFQLCVSCYDEHERLEDEEKHPAGKKEAHVLAIEEVVDNAADTKDRDDIMESEFFDNRQAFLSLCQGNQYQYDTLRRAKHSSMMVLYHLHNPNAPAFITSCAICHSELEAGQGWKCKICTEFDVCNACFSSVEVQRHPHKFTARSVAADLSMASTDLRKQRMLQLRMMLDVLVHASKCRESTCQYAKCRNMKDLFRHGNTCTKRAMGGCSICKRMWFLLTTHAKACKESICTVPRCMDIRKHLKRTQLQQDSRRRAAVNEMIRQRVAEAAGGQ